MQLVYSKDTAEWALHWMCNEKSTFDISIINIINICNDYIDIYNDYSHCMNRMDMFSSICQSNWLFYILTRMELVYYVFLCRIILFYFFIYLFIYFLFSDWMQRKKTQAWSWKFRWRSRIFQWSRSIGSDDNPVSLICICCWLNLIKLLKIHI